MWDSRSQQTRYAPWLWTEKTENEKGRHKVEDYYRFDYISLKQKTISLHAG
jgi:hypothetical protein